jgi:hypothetical protein
MKTPYLLVALLTCGFLNGCAHEQTQPPGNAVAKPVVATSANQTATFFVVAPTNGPLYYQWQFSGTNILGVANR